MIGTVIFCNKIGHRLKRLYTKEVPAAKGSCPSLAIEQYINA
ncbi:hypothetical protein D930_00951 [Enterococcus faecalis KI-6-1-110608-1]|nr:hypothetical protein D930_00951 [Enterococcus faecalis KI-6-1-110608-1]